MKGARRLVIDASVAQAAGEAAATDPKAMNCRGFLQAAMLARDRMVASLHETARALFRALAGKLRRIAKVVWINPGSEDDSAVAWLRGGAKAEPARRLGYRRKRKG